MVSLRRILGFAVTQYLLSAASPHGPRGDIVTLEVPPGHGWNGTLVVDMSKATDYLEREAGIRADTFMAFLGRPQSSPSESGYKLPNGSGSMQALHVKENSPSPIHVYDETMVISRHSSHCTPLILPLGLGRNEWPCD